MSDAPNRPPRSSDAGPEIDLGAGRPPMSADAGRRPLSLIIGIVAAFLVCSVGAGLVWWGMTANDSGSTAATDVPVIAADTSPIKVKPDDPGGLDIADRDKLVYRRVGDDGSPAPVERLLPPPEKPRVLPTPQPVATAPAPGVGTGTPTVTGTEPGSDQIPTGTASSTPSPDTVATAPSASVPQPTPPAATETTPVQEAAISSGTHRIQLASVRTEAEAVSEWRRIRGRNTDLLGAFQSDISRVELGERGTWYRVRSTPVGDAAEAKALCAALRTRKVDCLVVRPGG